MVKSEKKLLFYRFFILLKTGTKTGKALKYVNDELLKRGRPDVPDVILLLTDGRATDDVKSPADELRTKSVEVKNVLI